MRRLAEFWRVLDNGLYETHVALLVSSPEFACVWLVNIVFANVGRYFVFVAGHHSIPYIIISNILGSAGDELCNVRDIHSIATI